MFRGGLAKMYYESTWTDGADIPATPTWTEVVFAVDVSFNGDGGAADVSSRVTNVALNVEGLQNWEVTFGYRSKQGADTAYEKFAAAWVAAKSPENRLLIAVMDGDIATSGNKGWQAVYMVSQLNEEQPNADGALTNITLAPAPGFDASGALIAPTRLIIP
jgi:hypothetical protein